MECCLCATALPPGNRTYLKSKEEEIKCVLDVLKKRYIFSVDELEKYLKEKVICRRGKCQNNLTTLLKLKKELSEVEGVVFDTFGGLIVNKGFATLHETESTEGTFSPEEARSANRQSLLPCTPKSRKYGTSSVGVVYYGKGKSRFFRLPASLCSIGRSLGRKKRKSIVRQMLKDKRMKFMAIQMVGDILRKELRVLCRADACFCDKDVSALEQFKWGKFAEEMKTHSPSLYTLLHKAINEDGLNRDVAMVMCTALLLRNHSTRANTVQRLMSTLLYASHAPKQLYTRLSKVGICVSHKTTIRIIDEIGTGFDCHVTNWCKDITTALWGQQSRSVPISECNNSELTAQTESVTSPDTTEDTTSFEMVIEPDESLLSDGSQSDKSTHSSVDLSPIFSLPDSDLSGPLLSDLSSLDPFEDGTDSINMRPTDQSSTTSIPTCTFKVVGDNVDKHVRPRHETADRHSSSLHYFHSFAVKDRVEMSGLADNYCLPDISSFTNDVLLPTTEDNTTIFDNYVIIAARIIQKKIPFFRDNVPTVTRHIPHIYSKEMSKKSDVVPLGVLFKNEIVHEDMVEILSHLQQYVPRDTKEEEILDETSNETFKVHIDNFHYLLFGGDQLTVERAMGSKKERSNETRGLDRLEGFIPVIEDWHAKVACLKAIWKVLYKTSSGTDSCTLYHLRNLLMRRSVTKKIKSDPTACEEFFILVLEAHILSIALTAFDLASLDGTPKSSKFNKENFLDASSSERKEVFLSSVKNLLSDKIYRCEIGRVVSEVDQVCVYGKELLSLGMLYLEFVDSIREGDGLRILRCWKYLMLLFKATNKRKYALQGATLLIQYNFVFTDRMKSQLLWSRTINTEGRAGRNVAMDFHMEHLNRDLKSAIGHLSSNVNKGAIERIGKSLYKLSLIKDNFDSSTEIARESTYHSTPSLSKDLQRILEELQKKEVFKKICGRKHSSFQQMKGNIFGTVKEESLTKWLKDHYKKLLREL